jgi:hypothetical protein
MVTGSMNISTIIVYANTFERIRETGLLNSAKLWEIQRYHGEQPKRQERRR